MNLQDSLPASVSDNSITLRYEVQESDLATVRDIVESTGFFYPAEVDVAVELVEERLRRGDSSGYFFAFVELNGRTVGYSCYGPIACTTSSFDIFWIAIHSDAQRHGMGKWLMSVTEELIFDRGGERIYVETSGRDHYLPTRKFYDRCGYQKAAELPEFYGKDDSKVIYLKTKPVAASAVTTTITDTTPQPGTPPKFDSLLPEFQRLCEIVARLRAPDGCPWDRQQTMKTTDDVKRNWHAIKRQEKPARESQLEGIPLALPELARAARITARAAAVGYDFPDRRMLFDKLNEELQELAVELFGTATIPTVLATVDADRLPDEPMAAALQDKAESELGDVLFVLANIGRRWGINPEEALRRSNAKFSRRFQAIEEAMKQNGRSMHDATLREMEDAYQAAKRREPVTTKNGMAES